MTLTPLDLFCVLFLSVAGNLFSNALMMKFFPEKTKLDTETHKVKKSDKVTFYESVSPKEAFDNAKSVDDLIKQL